jgi:hypothetical protein
MSEETKYYMTPKGVLSFTNQLVTPKSFEGGAPKYGVTILFDAKAQASPEYKKLEEVAEAKLTEKFGAKAATMKLKRPFLSGDDYPNYNGYAGKTFLRLSSNFKPEFVNKKAEEIPFDQVEDEIYSGCFARVTVNAYAYDTSGNRGVAFGLRNVQKLGEGEKIGGRGSASSEFGAIEDDGEALDDAFSKMVG